VILSPFVMGYDTHWTSGRTMPCTKRTGHCKGCEVHAPYKWIGWLHCLEIGQKEEFFLELTDHAFYDAERARGAHATYRGLSVIWIRKRSSMKSPVVCTLINPDSIDNDRLPPSKDVEPALRVAWREFFLT